MIYRERGIENLFLEVVLLKDDAKQNNILRWKTNHR